MEPHRGDRAKFFDRTNWQALCKPCHSRKTAREVWHGGLSENHSLLPRTGVGTSLFAPVELEKKAHSFKGMKGLDER
ncbi:hypothetical protein [Roseovarius nubinhibens]|uniref:hypothetical protein n=1 Tax=Roseovarius nubinhibens TaxID=314263 RepID=UPI0030B903D8